MSCQEKVSEPPPVWEEQILAFEVSSHSLVGRIDHEVLIWSTSMGSDPLWANKIVNMTIMTILRCAH